MEQPEERTEMGRQKIIINKKKKDQNKVILKKKIHDNNQKIKNKNKFIIRIWNENY